MSQDTTEKKHLERELAALRKRVAELEEEEPHYEAKLARADELAEALQKSEGRFRSLFSNRLLGIWEEDFSEIKKYVDSLKANGVSDFATYYSEHPDVVMKCLSMIKIIDVNQRAVEIHKAKNKEELLRMLPEFFSEETFQTFKRELTALSEGYSTFEEDTVVVTLDGGRRNISILLVIAEGYEASWDRTYVFMSDKTDRKRAEEALQQSIILEEKTRTQLETLTQLSTPLIPINDRVIIMPIIGAVDAARTQLVMEALLHGVASRRAAAAILDITGITGVDAEAANGLVRAAQAVELLGARVILTGISPQIAQTLVSLGIDLSKLVTHSSLQAGIAHALRLQ